MINKTKTCTKCGEIKLLDEFHNQKAGKNGKHSRCNECKNEIDKKYRQEHKKEKAKHDKEYYQEHKDEIRTRQGSISMHENKSCTAYLGIVIGERLCKHLFKDVEIMPYGFPGHDIICNKGKKINIKTACVTLDNNKHSKWSFFINYNTIVDFFILIAFDNRTDLNPLHLWMIPGSELNHQTSAQIRPSTIHKWDKWKRDINDAQLCCTELKSNEFKK